MSVVAGNFNFTPNPYFENNLVDLTKYGKVFIIQSTGGGWRCSVDMHVSTAGTTFEVKSDIGQSTPSAAVDQCHKRIIETLKLYKDKL